MSDLDGIKHLEQKKRSKKIKKTFNLFDFVVVKQKNMKTKQVTRVKVSKQIQRRGKVRRKKLTTLKKKILRQRASKQTTETTEENLEVDTECLLEKFAEINLDEQQEVMDSSINELDHQDSLNSLPAQTCDSCLKHSRNFREYCNQFITQEIKTFTELVLKDLFKFQENKFQQNPVKAKANKRYVVGFKEVKKFLVVKRLKLVIIAPDLERNIEIEKLVDEVKSLADHHKIPLVFSIKRRHIGYLLLKKVPVSLVGIFDYQGTTENVNQLLKLAQQEKSNYNKAKTAVVS